MFTALVLAVFPNLSADVVQSNAGPIEVEHLASLEFPWGMANLPDGSLIISEKPGRLRLFSNGQLSPPTSGVPKVAFHEQGGLLDVQADPHFAQNRLIYIYYSEAAPRQPGTADRWGPRLGGKPETPDNVLQR